MPISDKPLSTSKLFHKSAACGCGEQHSLSGDCSHLSGQNEPETAGSEDTRLVNVVEAGLMRALFPDPATRRAFLKAVGSSTAATALAKIFPIATTVDAFAATGAPEKTNLKVGFIPITCATPISLGLGSTAVPFNVAAIENINGQAITLAMKHKDNRDPKNWKGFKLAVPFDYSMHNYLLRYYLAEHGLDPDTDVQIRAIPPPEMVANLRADNIDGFLAPDNVCQRAVFDGVGFNHILSKEIWDGHPCCAFAASREFITQAPNAYAALLRAIIEASAFASKAENRKQIAEAIAPANYLNAPVTVIEQVLTGTYADGLGNVKKDPNRVTFDPFPWESVAVWMLTQMKRWGQLKGEVDYQSVAREVFLQTDAVRLMKEAGLTPPATSSKTFSVMGKTFDPANPSEYLASFTIKRA
jgi:nitrate/nitrite transport system substrate-binding protein